MSEACLALIAILRDEPEAKHCALAIEKSANRLLSAANFVETALVIDGSRDPIASWRSYLSAVSKFSRYFGRSPDRLHLEDVRAFQVYLVATGISWLALNQIVCALRFFYGVTLGQATVLERLT